MRCRQGRSWRIGILSFALAVRTAGAGADERKQLAFDVIERNAQQMAAISDSLFYFGELGMQEFESTKLLKDTLDSGRLQGRAGRRRHADQFLGRIGHAAGRKIAIVTEVDALPGGSQTPGTYERKPLVKDGARSHGRPQHPRRRRIGWPPSP